MSDKIISINKNALKTKLDKARKAAAAKAKEKASAVAGKLRETASDKKDALQNKIIDGSLAVNDKQRRFLKNLKK